LTPFFYRLEGILTNLFFVVWFGGIAFILLLAAAVKANKVGEKAQSRLVLGFIAVVGTFIILNGVSMEEVTSSELAAFDALRSKGFAAMTLSKNGKSVDISGRAEVDAFFTLLENAQTVPAHHSYPVDQVGISFPGARESYTLGRDSANADEFWLQVDRSDLPRAHERILRQFHSTALTAWLASKRPE
jgi:hypothetical protein